ncbi:cation:proton antiporter domain-containing protein, partial [Burkholderia pseudomallei]|uniref:cation:proton antiporter domain-containing protein n=1 Tax=Burkholderia pseudomallei TaxID=28450 RepID=UPI0018A2420C
AHDRARRIAEAIVMTMVGTCSRISSGGVGWRAFAAVVALFCFARPLAVALSLAGSGATRTQRRLMGWFGIRGIGSFYYLVFALERGPIDAVRPIAPLVLAAVAASVIVHGMSATPLMNWYHRLRASR